MVREKLMAHQHEKGFRWRGGEIARIEGLSDAVFAFAVTLLVVSLEVPKTFTELAVVMRGFFPFVICFGLLMQVWHEQYRYFRRYNLQDSMSTFLNCVLLFLVLFYVYPLKFLFTYLISQWMHFPMKEAMIEGEQVPQLMAIFSGGYLAVSCIFIVLFGHALRKRDVLELNAVEVFATRTSIGAAMLQALVALISVCIALFGPHNMVGLSGFVYPMLLSPGFTLYYMVRGRKQRLLT